jgi:formylglycine-generating enzyme required for sulfatase activity
MAIDPYKILGISRDATPEQIKRAYREKARKHHPDNGGDAWAFQQVQESYELLSGRRKTKTNQNPGTARPTEKEQTKPTGNEDSQKHDSNAQPEHERRSKAKPTYRRKSSRRIRVYLLYQILGVLTGGLLGTYIGLNLINYFFALHPFAIFGSQASSSSRIEAQSTVSPERDNAAIALTGKGNDRNVVVASEVITIKTKPNSESLQPSLLPKLKVLDGVIGEHEKSREADFTRSTQPEPVKNHLASPVIPIPETGIEGRPEDLVGPEVEQGNQVAVRVLSEFGIELVEINPGLFELGVSESELARAANYAPKVRLNNKLHYDGQHEVRISNSYFIGAYEISVEQFRKFVESTGYLTDAETGGGLVKTNGKWNRRSGVNWRNPEFAQSDQHPVVFITWNDASQYCQWLTAKAIQRSLIPNEWEFRLPTEAEWEFACRAGSESMYFFGDSPDELINFANFADNSMAYALRDDLELAKLASDVDDGYSFTSPIGTFQANGFGIFDIYGNVGEWVLDSYDAYPASPVQDPFKQRDIHHVIRGGSWRTPAMNCRSAARSGMTPSHPYGFLGFRIVLGVKVPRG